MDDRTIPEFKSLKELRAFANTRPDKFPKGKHFKHVVLDADDTLWKVRPWGVASICVPEGKTSSDELPVRCTWERDKQRIKVTGVIKLDPTARETLNRLKEKNIGVSIASQNDKKVLEKHLAAFGILDQFSQVEADWDSSKAEMVARIARSQGIDADDILYVDDMPGNAAEVAMETGATSLVKDVHIDKLSEILRYLK